jgi:hypothetical protein
MDQQKRQRGKVPLHALLFLAGGLWLCIGIMLVSFAISWLTLASAGDRYVFGAAGIVLALVIHHFGFLKIVDRNLSRLRQMRETSSIFSFMPWRSYVLVPLMMAMGFILRHSAISKKDLAVVYIGIGLALVLSSVRYLRHFLNEAAKQDS